MAAALLLLAGCAWSNSLYRARTLAADATRAEREHRPGEAQTLWGQVAVKAESAYARSPRGAHGAEALWLAGHAAARTNDCPHAVRALQGALFSSATAPWHAQLLLDLGQCEEATGAPTAAAVYAMLAATGDAGQRRVAGIREGHVLLSQGSWTAALAALPSDDTLPVRLDRAAALAELGRDQDALAELTPVLASGDTTIRWSRYLEPFARSNTAATDSLLERLMRMPPPSAETQSGWWLSAARGAMDFDRTATESRLAILVRRPGGPSVTEGRMLQLQLRLSGAATTAELRRVLDATTRQPMPEGSFAAIHVTDLQRFARQLLGHSDSLRAGAPQGDLVAFALAEFARDSLEAPLLGASLFARIERDWPASPYVAKALLARAALLPDSSDALLARLHQRADNPFVRAANGSVAAQVRVAQLEDSLGRFIHHLWINTPVARRAPDL